MPTPRPPFYTNAYISRTPPLSTPQSTSTRMSPSRPWSRRGTGPASSTSARSVSDHRRRPARLAAPDPSSFSSYAPYSPTSYPPGHHPASYPPVYPPRSAPSLVTTFDQRPSSAHSPWPAAPQATAYSPIAPNPYEPWDAPARRRAHTFLASPTSYAPATSTSFSTGTLGTGPSYPETRSRSDDTPSRSTYRRRESDAPFTSPSEFALFVEATNSLSISGPDRAHSVPPHGQRGALVPGYAHCRGECAAEGRGCETGEGVG
ncbi:hypothetical protein EJ06DRAFT_548964 [Trichodelitschia bisporula]|uniref:Uncharacterized protein n=1 Tax=Trichodelitschia bisporula TaxID=703511 RepID=A0A6G1HW27_9PEZI|nr:hypothetical protein EJ06DRAFT_548964 [Trichodelitschia bisporula]